MAPSTKLLALICAIASCAAGTAFAARGCGSEGGMGGTGRPVVGQEQNSRPSPSPTGGIGGTGITASAGVVGVVTGFASICVNGSEVHYRTDTPVEVDGRQGAARDLERGQVVRVDATQISAEEYRATRIAVLEALIGPVTQIDPKRRMFWVMGQPVRLMSDAVVALSGAPSEQALAAFDASDRVLLVSDPSVASIRGTQRALKLCGSLGYGADKTAIVLHDFDEHAPLAPADAAVAFKREIYFTLSAPSAAGDDSYSRLAGRLMART